MSKTALLFLIVATGFLFAGGGPFCAAVYVAKAPPVVEFVPPVYPEAARESGVEGTVVLHTVIDRQGSVMAVNVVESLSKGVSDAAAEAVRRWKFEPVQIDGQPALARFLLEVEFELESAEGDSSLEDAD